jgi:NitT/TauT family transport system substrate-binding protein
MKKARILSFILLFFISLVAAVYYFYVTRPSDTAKIHISSNPWIGFTPFIYAQEKGWLEKTRFQFIWLVNLDENAHLHERGFTQGFTATQYELLHFNQWEKLKPVFLIDRSYGADAIVSNRSIEELKSSKEMVDVYLEQGTLNDDFLDAFIKENKLNSLRFHKIDASQKSILLLKVSKKPIMIISYQPYLSALLKKGYHPIASTRTMDSFFVIDALFVDEKTIKGREKEFAQLKELFSMAVERLRTNPHEYYETVKGYLEGQSYEEFIATTAQIEWLHQKNDPKIIEHLNTKQIKTDRVIP